MHDQFGIDGNEASWASTLLDEFFYDWPAVTKEIWATPFFSLLTTIKIDSHVL